MPEGNKEEILGQISDQAIASMMEEKRVFPPSEEFVKQATIKSMAEYKQMYEESIKQPEKFWGKIADELHWNKKWDTFRIYDFKDNPEQDDAWQRSLRIGELFKELYAWEDLSMVPVGSLLREFIGGQEL